MKFLLFIAIPFGLSFPLQPLNAIEKQRAENWCWAAAAQTVLAERGIFQRQTAIAAQLLDWPDDKPAFANQLAWLISTYGVKAWQAGRAGTVDELRKSFSNNWKLIALVIKQNSQIGHYLVLEGLDGEGNLIISDPATGKTETYPLTKFYRDWQWLDTVVVAS